MDTFIEAHPRTPITTTTIAPSTTPTHFRNVRIRTPLSVRTHRTESAHSTRCSGMPPVPCSRPGFGVGCPRMLNRRTLRQICGGWLLACWISVPQARAAVPAVAWNVAFSRTFTGDDIFRSSCTDAAGNTYVLYDRYNGGSHLLVFSPAGVLQRDDYLPDPNNMQYTFIAVDGSGHLYAAVAKYSGTNNIQVAQYDLATMTQLWEAPVYDSGQDDYVNGITADPTD